jgi:hypothetical protein
MLDRSVWKTIEYVSFFFVSTWFYNFSKVLIQGMMEVTQILPLTQNFILIQYIEYDDSPNYNAQRNEAIRVG